LNEFKGEASGSAKLQDIQIVIKGADHRFFNASFKARFQIPE